MGDAPTGPARSRIAAFIAGAVVVVVVIVGFAAASDSGSTPAAAPTVTTRGAVDPNASPTTAVGAPGPGSSGAGSSSGPTPRATTNEAGGGAPTTAATGSRSGGVPTKPAGSTLVPDLVGAPQPAATARLAKLGFAVSAMIESSTVPPGVVLRTTPDAGVNASKGTTVTLYVSRGDLADVPSWLGLASSTTVMDQIRTQADASRLRVAFAGTSSCQPDAGAATAGHFVAQSPAGGAQVPVGTLVVLTAQCP